MTNKVFEKIFISFLLLFSISALILGKIYNEKLFYFCCITFIVIITNCIVNKGMVFHIFKNPKITKKSKILLIFTIILFSVVIILNIDMSRWFMAICFLLMLISNMFAQSITIKKEIKGT